jgi:AcrR family transcriptional regulator
MADSSTVKATTADHEPDSSVTLALSSLVQEAIGNRPLTVRGWRTYDTILRSAERAFLIADYRDVAIESVASKSGVSVGSVYRYFGSKEGLFIVVLGDCLAEMYEAARKVWVMPWSYQDRLRASTAEFLRAYLRNRQVLGSAATLAAHSRRVREMNWAMRRLIQAAMEARLVQDNASGETPHQDPTMLIRVLTAMVDGYAHRAYVDLEFGESETTDERLEVAASVLSSVWFKAISTRSIA